MTKNPNIIEFTPIFVGGAMRTGTSLLQNILSTAPTANDMMVECQYLTAQLSLYANWRKKSERALTDFFNGADDFSDYTQSLVIDFLKRTHSQQGMPDHLILKHPEMTPFFPILAQFIPNARFITSVRDPKDVVASMLVVAEKQRELGRTSNMRQAGRNMQTLTKLFLSFYRGLTSISSQSPKRLQFLKYETLVTKPQALLPDISNFTGLDLSHYDPQADWKYTRPRGINKAFDTNIRGKGLSNSSIGNYKDALSEEEIAIVEKTAAKFMQYFRYPLHTNSKS